MRSHAPFPSSLVLAAALLLGCGTDFQPASDVDSLRVLAIQADTPIATPGSTVSLTMLSYDGSPKATRADGTPRPITIAWFGGCENPAGDAFYGCYDHVSLTPAAGSGVTIGSGATFSVAISPTIVSSHAASAGRKSVYGIAFVLYAVCGGGLVSVTPTDPSAPPLGCVDAAGATLDQQDFVFGYFPIYVYPDEAAIRTRNPLVNGGLFDGQADAPLPCSATQPCADGLHCGLAGQCIPITPRCTAHDTNACPKHAFLPTVDMASIENDALSQVVDGKTQVETLYVDYYASKGSVADGAKNIEAPNLGWNTDYGTTWSAPDRGGEEARIFAVVRNNRGGVSWWYKDVFIQ